MPQQLTKWQRHFLIPVILLSMVGCGDRQPHKKKPLPVKVDRVALVPTSQTIIATGEIQARVQSDLSFRVGGKIIQRLVEVGDTIKVGQPLARLDPNDLEHARQSAKARVEAARAQWSNAQTDFRRQAYLLPRGYTSRSQYDQAQAAQRSTRSALTAAEAQLAYAEEQLGYTVLRSPASGIITARHAEAGQVVAPSTPVFTLAEQGDRDAIFHLGEALASRIDTLKPLQITLLENTEISVTGHIREIAPSVLEQTATVQVKIALENPHRNMPLGAAVSVTLAGQTQSAFRIPWSALDEDNGIPMVWMIDRGHRASLRPVQVMRYDADAVLITKGLQNGDMIVTQGAQLLYPGQEVTSVMPGIEETAQ